MDRQRALQEKAKGNDAFVQMDWVRAVGFYTAAQMADPTEPTIPLNRAMAYLKLNKFEDAERDCTTALRLSPDNVKATFRRAKARTGAGRLQEAEADFQQVLRLDPKNKEAEEELSSVRAALQRNRAKRNGPLDLAAMAPSPRANRAGANDSGSGNEHSEKDDDDGVHAAAGASSSVEAARKFLQQVGMQDPPKARGGGNGDSASVKKLPERLPGETGGLLREISSKKVAPAQSQLDAASTESAASPLAWATSSERTAAIAQPSVASAQARKTASALSFGLGSTATPAPSQPRPPSAAKPAAARRLNAVEFQRIWKERSRLPASSPASSSSSVDLTTDQQIARRQLRFLQTLDPATLPTLLDQLLEPDLLSALLFCLEANVRMAASLEPNCDADTRPIRLSKGNSGGVDRQLLDLVRGLVTELPRVKRFAMLVAMLDASEKRAASTLIHALEDSDALEPTQMAEAHKVWEV
ncbi:hypothetical protein ACQY0O_004392 [Thecaphora frezii]